MVLPVSAREVRSSVIHVVGNNSSGSF